MLADNHMEGLIETCSPRVKDVEYFSHALLAVGYSDQSKAFIVRNSWGENWVRRKENLNFKEKIILG